MNPNTQKYDIIFLTPAMGVGGVGRQLLEVSKLLSNRGHDVRIISLTPIGTFGKQAKSAGIPVESLNIENKLLAPIAIWKVHKAIQSLDPDVLHAHLFHAIIVGRLASIGVNTSIVSTIHNTYDQNPETHDRTVRDRLYSLTDKFSDITTFVSDTAQDRYVRVGAVPEEKSLRVYNGIDTTKFKTSKYKNKHPSDFIWVSVGNLEEQKDYFTLLESIKIIDDSDVDFTVLIIGDGQLESDLKQKAKHLEVDDTVEFTGRVDSVVEYLSIADGFVLSSQWEGFGLVVAEAMACELPVVSTNAGGPSEIVVDGKTGLLVERRNPNELATAMETIMDLPPHKRNEYGSNGRQRIEELFSIENAVDNWETVYEKGINNEY